MGDPIVLEPIYQARVWGGRNLETVYGRKLPGDDSLLIGESWDVVDREEAQSVVTDGPYKGHTLGDLWSDHREEIFGMDAPHAERFPILCKILDVRQTLSVQVHPPPGTAEELGGEPKSEYWYAAKAEEEALWYVGLKPGITKDDFEQRIQNGTASKCLVQQEVTEGHGLYVPSGTVHAIGAGQVIFEIQENSDTTYRVYDWDRDAGEGKRKLHLDEAMQSIDFEAASLNRDSKTEQYLVDAPEFRIQEYHLPCEERVELPAGVFSIIAIVSGTVDCGGRTFVEGDYFLVPADRETCVVTHSSQSGKGRDAAFLRVTWPAST